MGRSTLVVNVLLPLVLIVVLTMGMAVFFVTSTLHDRFVDIFKEQMHDNVERLSVELTHRFDEQRTLLKGIAHFSAVQALYKDPTNQALYTEVRQGFEALFQERPYYENIGLLYKQRGNTPLQLTLKDRNVTIGNGAVFVDAIGGTTVGRFSTELPYIFNVIERGVPSISKPYRSITSQRPLFILAEPVRIDGELVGAVGAAPRFEHFLKDFTEGEGLFLCDTHGTILAHKDPAKVFNTDITHLPYADTLFGSLRGFAEYQNAEGNVWVYYTKEPRTGWYLVAELHEAEIAVHYIGERNMLFMFAGIAIVFILFLGLMTIRSRVIQPLNAIQKLIMEYRPGVTMRADEMKIYSDEFATIGTLFEKMSRLLNQTYARTQRHEALLNDVSDATEDLIFYKDTDFTYLGCNEAFAQALGRSKEEIIGQNDFDLFPKERAERYREADEKVLAERKTLANYDNTYIIGGTPRYLFTQKSPLVNNQGAVYGLVGTARDITEHHEMEKYLEEWKERYELAIEGSNDGLWDCNMQSKRFYASPIWRAMMGYSEEETFSNDCEVWLSTVHPDDQERVRTYFKTILKSLQTKFETEYRARRKDGSYFWVLSRGRVVYNGDMATRIVGNQTDIDERKHLEETIREQAYFDTLTKLPNRQHILERIQIEITSKHEFGLFFFDLDHFKMINDTMGHTIGDKLLQAVAERIRSLLRPEDFPGRLGGDEFVIVVPHMESTEAYGHHAKSFIDAIHKPWQIDGHEFIISTSLGISLYPHDGVDAKQLLKNADIAMYQAKEAGRNNYHFFTESMDTQVHHQMRLEQDMRRGIEQGEFHLYYQPQIAAIDESISGAEALIRWHHPELGTVNPAEFITLAEHTGFIIPLGEWIIKEACLFQRTLSDLGYPSLKISVNISARQFQHSEFIQSVDRLLRETNANPAALTFEITETIFAGDKQTIIAVLNQLRERGIRTSLDDFGTGYSSLSYLKTLPLDAIKIDRSFVQNVDTDFANRSIAKTILALGHGLGLDIVAEGVETENEVEFLKRNACPQMQGYFYAKPLPKEEFLKRLTL